MAFHNHSSPDNRLPNENPTTPQPPYHPRIPIPQPAAVTASRNPSPTYMTFSSNPVSRENLLQSSQDAVATYSRLVTGQMLQQAIPRNNTTEEEEFLGMVTIMIPPLLVLVVIGINGETIKRIQRESGVMRIHIHNPPGTADFSDRGLPRKCEIWGIEERVRVAKREIEDIVSSNRISPLISDTQFLHRCSTLTSCGLSRVGDDVSATIRGAPDFGA